MKDSFRWPLPVGIQDRQVLGITRCGQCLACILFVITSVGCTQQTPEAAAAQNQQIEQAPPDPYVHDIGRLVAGEVVSHAFVFTNNGEEPIAIGAKGDVTKDCGCSSVKPEVWELRPGQSTSVIVTIYTQSKSGRFANGGAVTWISSSGKKQVTTLIVKG